MYANGFNEFECKRWWSSASVKLRPENHELRQFHGSIPYVPGLSEKVRDILREVGINVGMKPSSTLRGLLTRKRPQPAAILGSVYKIPCAEDGCSWSYIGETGRTLDERKKEHCLAVRNLDVERSEVARHVHENDHQVDLNSMHIVEREAGWKRRLVKEALWTKRLKSSNRTKHFLSSQWDFITFS